MTRPMNLSARSLAAWAFGIALAAVAGTAGAAVLYEQSPKASGIGYYANTNVPQQLADDFTLSGGVSLEGITWWGGYDAVQGTGDQNDDSFLVRLYSSVSGTGAVLQEFSSASFTRSASGLQDTLGNNVYQYDFTLAVPVGLASGTYHLFVQNLGTSDWFWQQASSGNTAASSRADDTSTWASLSGDLAFRLNGTRTQVPEPGSLALLLLAGAGLALTRRHGTHRQ